MVKMAGCADHGHTRAPCPKCVVRQDQLATVESLMNGESCMVYNDVESE